jgi:TRAP-type C4-dicarboxylate transport system substrate-binding protein
MNRTRRCFGLSLSALCITLAGSQVAEAKKPDITIRVVTPFPAGHILADTATEFARRLEAQSDRYTVTVATSVLNEQTINPQLTSCDPAARVGDIVITGGQLLQDYAPAYFFFNGPYVIEDYAHFQRVWRSHLGDEAQDLIEANGNLVTLGTVYRGFRQFTSNAPITGPDSFVGLRLRLPPTPDWITVWSSLGVVPVTVPLTGIYAALRDGVAQASEGDLTQINSLLLYEVQSHLSLTNHLVGFGLAAANACFLAVLPHSDEVKIRRAMRKASAWGTEQMESREASLLASLQSNGMTVVTPDADAIREAARPAIESLFATKWTVTTWDEVLDLAPGR